MVMKSGEKGGRGVMSEWIESDNQIKKNVSKKVIKRVSRVKVSEIGISPCTRRVLEENRRWLEKYGKK